MSDLFSKIKRQRVRESSSGPGVKYQVKTVRGSQAEMAKSDLGLVKIAESSARDLFDMGIPFVIVGNNVNSYHFFGGWNLAFRVNPQRYAEEGWSFDQFVNNWSVYNENSETGKAAFFVDEKYVAKVSR